MNYTTLNIGNKELKLRINTRSLVQLEKTLGRSPLAVLMEVTGDQMPATNDLLIILQASLQALEHGYNMDAVYDLYDELIEDGNTIVELINLIVEVLKVSGIIPKEIVENGEEKESPNA